MIAALQRAHPRLAALLGIRDKASTTDRQPPRAQPATVEGFGANLPFSQGGAQPEGQRALQQFYEIAPERLPEMRSQFGQISATPEGPARQAILGKLYSHVRVLRSLCDAPGLESVGKVTGALERLLKQMSEQPSNVSPSALRTTASSIVLLETLTKPGLTADLALNPPPRFLSIDDDPVCRLAVSSSLRQAFTAPEEAENGATALALVEKRAYDMIFLDVEMPGINGFEVCTRIHQAKLNRDTPVVFVTVHRDFDSRAKASDSGGHDFIGKPFLPSELTLKALTILLRRRIEPAPPAAKPTKPV